jgi:2-methylfumaryl-CoA hydratase
LAAAELPLRHDIGALRTRLVAVKNRSSADFARQTKEGEDAEGVVLDLDLWQILPR